MLPIGTLFGSDDKMTLPVGCEKPGCILSGSKSDIERHERIEHGVIRPSHVLPRICQSPPPYASSIPVGLETDKELIDVMKTARAEYKEYDGIRERSVRMDCFTEDDDDYTFHVGYDGKFCFYTFATVKVAIDFEYRSSYGCNDGTLQIIYQIGQNTVPIQLLHITPGEGADNVKYQKEADKRYFLQLCQELGLQMTSPSQLLAMMLSRAIPWCTIDYVASYYEERKALLPIFIGSYEILKQSNPSIHDL